MYDERTPLYREPRPTYTSPYRRYNKMGIVNCISCAILGMLTAALLILMIAYFEMTDNAIFPPSQDVNSSLFLSLENANISRDQIMEAFNLAEIDLNRKEELDRENPTLNFDSPSYKHQQVLKGEAGSYAYSRKGYLLNRATNYLSKSHPEEKMSSIKTPNWLELDFCDENEEKCDSPYRKIDGYCNNKKHPKMWGVAMRPFARSLPAEYCDGVEMPRCAKDETPLPSSRLISVELHRPEYKTDPNFTYMFAIWGQFIDHDISSTSLNKGVDGQYLSCCGGIEHPECYPVNISSSDAYYSQYGVDCMEFVRSAPSPTCSLGPREQLNQVTSYLDGSAVYGNTEELARNLREFSGGRLRMHFTKDGRELLPISFDLKDGCNREEEAEKGRYCFLSGDSRANENLHLTTMHLIMARQHNKIASKLSNLNPMWEDEKVYQESRKIVIAQMQHITYNEFLTPLLGDATMKKYKLNSEEFEYDENTDASMNNNFASAAFRFAHTLLPKLMKIGSNNDMTPELVELHKILFNPFRLYDAGSVDAVLEGAIGTKADKLDRFFNTEMTQHLFEDEKPTAQNKMCGLDLVTLNLQRGRDHGLPGYTKWRKFCGLSEVNSFSDLDKIMDPSSIQVLKTYYKDIDDIDLYSGALSEVPAPDAILGLTTTCLIAKQFNKIKLGDRYWYETAEQPQAFTKEQLGELKKTTLASILCENSDSLKTIRKHVMKTMESESDEINCDVLDQVNLKYWSDPNMNDLQMNLRGDAKPSKPGKPSKPAVNKMFASATLLGGEIYGSFGDNEPIKLYDGLLPAIVYVDNFTDPDAYDVSAQMEWEGTITNDLLSGTFTIPVTATKIAPGATTAITNWKGNFSAIFKYKWGGSLSFVEPHKTYKCKMSFTAFGQKAANEGLRLQESTEFCKIMLEGTFYKKPFYCYLTPWWCTDEKIYYWNGDIKLSITKPADDNNVEKLKKIEGPMAKKPIEKKFTKTYTSVAVTGGQVMGSYDGSNSVKLFDGSLPVDINTENFHGAYDYFTLTNIDWEAQSVTDDAISGTYSIPIKTPNSTEIKYWKGSFSSTIRYKWGDPLDTIEPNQMQKCKVMFIPDHEMLASENLAMEMKFEFCVIKLSGKFTGKMFTWNGDVQLMMKRMSLLGAAKKPAGSYASVMIVGGEVTGSADGISTMRLFDGTLPMTINTESFLGPYPNLALHSIDWEGQLTSNETLMGTYTLPINGVQYKGNFAFTFKYLKGLINIEPNKNYKCKIVMVPQHLMQGIESSGCTIKLMGTFIGNEFTWDGNVQLMIKPAIPMISSAQKKTAGSYASMMVVSGEVTGTSGGSAMRLFDGNLPVTINTANFLGPYPNLALQSIDWEGQFASNETLMGTYSLPLSNGVVSKGNFVFTVKYLKGSLNIEPNKNYKCKIVLVPQNVMQAIESSGCTLKLMGTFVGNDFTWDGNVQMMIKQSTPMLASEKSTGMMAKSSGSYASVMVVGGEVTDGGSKLFDGTLPMTINTANFLGPYPNLALHSIDWQGQFTSNETLSGTWSNGVLSQGNFALTIKYLKGSLNIEPNKNYKCKIVLVPQHLMQAIESSGCTIKIMGTFVGNDFTWDGNVQMMIKQSTPMLASEKSTGMMAKSSGSYASVMVVGGEVTDGGSKLFDGTLPMTINTANFLGPYPNLALHSIDWQGQFTSNETLSGTWSNGVLSQGNFALTIKYLKGSLNIEPNKNYKCKIVLVPQHLMQAIESSGCTIKIMGTFVGNDFTWDGNVQIMMNKVIPKLAAPKMYNTAKVVKGEILGILDGVSTKLFDGSLPVSINTANFMGPYPNLAFNMLEWETQMVSGDTLLGTYSMPLMSNGTEKLWKGSFALTLEGDMINLIEANKMYKCKVILVPQHEMLASASSSECTLKLSGTFLGSMFTWDGNLQLIQQSKTMLKKTDDKPEKPEVIKMYASVSVSSGQITASYDGGEKMTLFDGMMPAEVYYANFTNPNSYDVSADIEWQGMSTNNKTVTGSFTLPVTVGENINQVTKYWKGNFTAQISYLWAGSLDVIEPHKIYKCKLMFTAFKQSSKLGKTIKDPESCTIMAAGWFYEKPFYCFITPWCGDDKIYYWNGDVELILRKPAPDTPNLLSLQDDDPNLNHNTFVNLHSHTIEGKVISGSLKLYKPDETLTWDGTLPVDIKMPLFWQKDPDMTAPLENATAGIPLQFNFFQSTISGSFKLPQYSKSGMTYLRGQFSFELSPLIGGSLYDMFVPDVEYLSALHFHDKDKKMPVLFQENMNLGARRYMNMSIIVLGSHANKVTKTINWDGKFLVIVNNIPYYYRFL